MKKDKGLFKYVGIFFISYFLFYNMLATLEIILNLEINFAFHLIFLFISVIITTNTFFNKTKTLPIRKERIRISYLSVIPYWATSIPEQYYLHGKIRGQFFSTVSIYNQSLDLLIVSIVMYGIFFITVFFVLALMYEIVFKFKQLK